VIERVIELALGLGAAGVTRLGLGIFHPHSTFFGPTLWHGPRDRPQVALTFDDGPHPTFTPRIARQLDEQGARATFFCVGAAVERNRDVVRALVAAGHEIGNHSYRHNTFGDLFVAARLAGDLARNQALLSTCAPAPRFYRPVAGVRNPKVHAAARQVGLSIVTWTTAPRDGVWALTPEKMRRLGARARPGDIIALHDGTLSDHTALRETTVRALPTLLDHLRARGLSCVTLSTLLAGAAAVPT
jgi:peptidoglycan/xylan/chitin deacetylase (PgdA/CDA1 family)